MRRSIVKLVCGCVVVGLLGAAPASAQDGDGSIVPWGHNCYGQCDVPAPNTDFVAVAAGASHSLGLKADGSIVAWGLNNHGQSDVPVPNANFDYATNVTVVEGESTTVQMGGIKLVTVEGAADGTYGIYDSTGQTMYASYNDPDIIITAPAGTFTLKEYFNPDFTYASNVEVVAGEVTEVEMGAIRYNGTLAYDIYVGGELVSSYNEADLIITAPAGTYTLTEYFDDENVLATNVVVTGGAVTDVP